jgi:hypothetical protein
MNNKKRFAGIKGARVIVLDSDAARAGVTPAAEKPNREATPAEAHDKGSQTERARGRDMAER